MTCDPFFAKIIDRLGGKLDPETFEHCAADLLRRVYPGLVPIPGGSDSGMDGAIPEAAGPQIPLVTTTGRDVLRNLKKNLGSYLKGEGASRTVVLATSQSLTPKKRANLIKAATNLGFHLQQIHERASIADHLYGSPRWCKDLLNLAGDPPALSRLPKSERPLSSVTLVGRDEDLVWLRKTQGDSLLVGQPGSGKTALHQEIVRDGHHLFIVSENMGLVADALRAQTPRGIIIDDAHLHLELIGNLVHFRQETGLKFDILANCWPGEQERVERALQLQRVSVREVALLTRNQVVEVIHACGLGGPPGLVQEIVEQADGRPGLAATLCYLALSGRHLPVVLGDAIANEVRHTFERTVGPDVMPILAGLSIGGAAGMVLSDVAAALGLPLATVQDRVTRLAAGGVIHEWKRGLLAVRPAALREVLVRDFFFCGARSLPVDQFRPLILDSAAHVDVLVGSCGRGAQIPRNQLLDLILSSSDSSRSLVRFAYLNTDSCRLALDRCPDRLMELAAPALHRIPAEAIPRLLSARAAAPGKRLLVNGDDPIDEWVRSAEPGSGEVIRRREILLTAARTWLSAGGDREVAAAVFGAVLSLAFRATQTQPGSGLTISFWQGSVTPDEATQIQSYWPAILNLFTPVPGFGWKELRKAIEDRFYPLRLATTVAPGLAELLRPYAVQMLHDILPLAQNDLVTLRWAKELIVEEHLGAAVAVDPEFEVLFPPENLQREHGEQERLWNDAVARKSEEWAKESASAAVPRLVALYREARAGGVDYPDLTERAFMEIASRVPEPLRWIDQLIAAQAPMQHVSPFLQRVQGAQPNDWQPLAERCLGIPALRTAAIDLILRDHAAPGDLVDHALAAVGGLTGFVQTLCFRGNLRTGVILKLLRHPDVAIRSAAAMGVWYGSRDNTIPDVIRVDWSTVVTRDLEERNVDEVLESHPEICADWLKNRIASKSRTLFLDRGAVRAATQNLTVETRSELLVSLTPDHAFSHLVAALVGNSVDVFHSLLSTPSLKPLHLYPLSGHPDGAWISKAVVALDAGYLPEDLVGAAHYEGNAWAGSEAAMWQRWVDDFERLRKHADARIRQVGEIGKSAAERRRDEARREEHQADVFGRV